MYGGLHEISTDSNHDECGVWTSNTHKAFLKSTSKIVIGRPGSLTCAIALLIFPRFLEMQAQYHYHSSHHSLWWCGITDTCIQHICLGSCLSLVSLIEHTEHFFYFIIHTIILLVTNLQNKGWGWHWECSSNNYCFIYCPNIYLDTILSVSWQYSHSNFHHSTI